MVSMMAFASFLALPIVAVWVIYMMFIKGNPARTKVAKIAAYIFFGFLLFLLFFYS